MARAEDTEIIDTFEEFYRDYYRNEIGQLAQKYPNEKRSLYVEWDDLYRFDPDLADDFVAQPDQMRDYAEEALRLYDLPVDVKLGQAHVRVRGLNETTGIRDIRARHRGQLVEVTGIIRKATDVRPKIIEAAFECQRCGTLTRIPQTSGEFHEPHECQGCERQGPFDINFDQSEFVDAQKIRVQESPEGLRGGETPQSIDVHIDDDITGRVTAGDHVRVTGVLHLDQQGSNQEKSPVFDVYMDGMAVEIEDEQFEDMDITDEDKKRIIELSNETDIYEQMVGSMAPSIYGYDQQKLAIILQLFSGVTKDLPDGSRIRGDLHMLLIGDPGTGKCQKYDTKVTKADGTEEQIGDLVERTLDDPVPVDDGVYQNCEIPVLTTDGREIVSGTATKVWKRTAPDRMYEIETASGRTLEVTPSHPLFVHDRGSLEAVPAEELSAGEFVATPRTLPNGGEASIDVDADVVPNVDAYLREIREALALSQFDCGLPRTTYQHYERGDRNPSREGLRAVLDAFDERLAALSSLRDRVAAGEWNAVREAREELNVSQSALADGMDVTQTAISYYERNDVVPDGGRVEDAGSVVRDRLDAALSVADDVDRLRSLVEGEIAWDRIKSIEAVDPDYEWVYDLEVEDTHSYVANNVLSHNSQLLQYVKNIAPRSVYTSGKGSSSAGLCVTGDTTIHTDDGFEPIRDLVTPQLPDPVDSETAAERRVGVHTFDRDAGEMLEADSSHVWRMPEKPCRRIETAHGKELEASMNTPVLTCDETGLGWTEISEVTSGDYVAVPEGDRGVDSSAIISESNTEEVADAALRWDEVVSATDTGRKEVFDLTVPETNNFVGNGIVTHNTAAAVRDDFGDGQQWTLEAGALVLADQGIAAVDELDKMRCVTGDTLVHLSDGRIDRIKELARKAQREGRVEELAHGRTIRNVDLTAWTMADDGAIVERPVTAIHEYEAPDELTRVTLESGEAVTATHDHPFFVFEDGERKKRPATDLEPGDWTYVPRRLSQGATDGGTVSIDGDAPGSTEPIGPSLGAVLGYLSGDGNVYYDREEGSYGIRFTNKEEALLEDFTRACATAFGKDPVRHPSEQRADGVETVRLHGREYADSVLEAGMNVETYADKSFPAGVTTGTRETKATFVRAFADSEGTVDTDTGNVRIYSASEELLSGIKGLLLEFGVSCQIRLKERTGKLDLYVLTITSAGSLRAYNRWIGFTLERKQDALDEVCAAADGDRTIIDVLPDCGELFEEIRASLRLYQSECGITDSTYCNFETGEANCSLHRAETILETFEKRIETAEADGAALADDDSWDTIERIKERYHVSQTELATDTQFSQQQLSREWRESEAVRETVRAELRAIVDEVANTELSPLDEYIGGDVKWRRVSSVETVTAGREDDRIEILRGTLADHLDCHSSNAMQRARELLDRDREIDSWETLRDALDRYGIPLRVIGSDLDVAGSTISRWSNGVVETDRFEQVKTAAENRIEAKRSEIRTLVDEIEARREPKVYDLTVDGTHNFVANGMVVHNSEDQSAMHQALEQQEISVSKAGINATLKSRCSLLAAANPVHGRFDEYEPFAEQIDLDPPLISRFDLIFTVTDQPDEEKDRNLANHIIETNYAGELQTHRAKTTTSNVSEEQVETVTENVVPDIEEELLRKYVAYAKRNCYPTMTETAKEAIRDFYVELRLEGQNEDNPVPITARKLEALVRLAEASARIRLSDEVTETDAERVIEIVRSSLEDVGVDPETGELDADIIESGTSKTQRDRIKNIKALISEIEAEYDEGAPIETVLDRAEEMGMERSQAEHEIEKLRRQGDVYEPTTDHLRTV